jgi:hypothetical protein
MLERLLRWLEAKLPKTTITIQGKPYLTRCYLFGKDRTWGNIYLHHFHSSDQGDELHNHPWEWGLSLILAGGYSEEFREGFTQDSWWVNRREKGPGQLNLIRAGDFHRVDLHDEQKGAWSLFFAGPRTSDWGFWDRHTKEFKDWRTNPEAIP